jgi:hypothetical protein
LNCPPVNPIQYEVGYFLGWELVKWSPSTFRYWWKSSKIGSRLEDDGSLLAKIFTAFYFPNLFTILCGGDKSATEVPSLSYDITSLDNIRALFPASGVCVLCLTRHEKYKCQRLAGSVPICPKPIGKNRGDTYEDLISMLLAGKYSSFTILTEPTIRAWIQFFRPETTPEEFSRHL